MVKVHCNLQMSRWDSRPSGFPGKVLSAKLYLFMLPLEGVKIVSVEQAVAAPLASRQFADFGARVIKIERPAVGDFARAYDHKVRGMSSWFVWLNRVKQSLTLDLKSPEAAKIARKLQP